MGEVRTYENFPAPMVAVSVLVTISIYALGALILAGLGPVVTAVYVLYCAYFEVRVMKQRCVNCCYYGKVCGLGRGKISAYLFPRGDPGKFGCMNFTWTALIPDMLIMLLPLFGGVILFVRSFSWMVAAGMVLLVAHSLGGNAFVRGQIACTNTEFRIISARIACIPFLTVFAKKEQASVSNPTEISTSHGESTPFRESRSATKKRTPE